MASTKQIYAIDRSVFPGPDPMTWLRDKAGIRAACVYLAPAPNHSDTSWMNVRADLACEGWGFIPTYLGEQKYIIVGKKAVPNPRLSASQGDADGKSACKLMKDAGFALGSVVYLDLEYGDMPSGAYQAYVLRWIAAVKAARFKPAIYCPGGVLAWALRYARVVWLAAPENLDSQGNAVPQTLDPGQLPAGLLGHGTIATQFLFEIDFAGLNQPMENGHGPRFDISRSLIADPSDYASVDEALSRGSESNAAIARNWAAQTARSALDRFKSFALLQRAVTPDTSPTSDPHCGQQTNAPDRLMCRDKVALDIAEGELAAKFTATVTDVGPTARDFADISAIAEAGAAADKFPGVKWPEKDVDAPDYHHMATSMVLPLGADGATPPADFELTPADIELVLAGNRMDPAGFDDMIVLAIRGARLGRLNDHHPPLDVEDSASIEITDTRQDHKNFRCLIGFYRRAPNSADRKLTLFTGSTVPNAEYVNEWFSYANGKIPSGVGNMMPTGCYVYRVGTHNSPHAGPIKPALRLTDSYNLHVDGSATVIRTKNNLSYDISDVWCKTIPGNNVHCSFQINFVPGWGAPFSSAGCMTIRGKQTPTDQWAKFQAILNKITMDKRCDVILLTGRDLAIASALRKNGDAGNATIVQRELGRLRPGSRGNEVARLQKNLRLDETGYFGSVLKKALVDEQSRRGVAIDGVYSPTLDQSWGWQVFTGGVPST
jgi:hypothetical protein